MSLHNLKATPAHKKKRIGRGGKRGTYSGRGLKGQRSRSGGKAGLKRLGLKALMQQTHKLKGFKSPHKKPETVNLKDLQKEYNEGETVSPQSLLKKGLIRSTRHGVKVLGVGKLTRKVKIKNCTMSKSVADAINKL